MFPTTAELRESVSRSLRLSTLVTLRWLALAGQAAAILIVRYGLEFQLPLAGCFALIGISAIEADGTLRDFDYREVTVARAIIEHSREVWLAADHSKFNRPAMVELGQLAQIDTLFTDAPPPEPFQRLLADAGVQCVVAEPFSAG